MTRCILVLAAAILLAAACSSSSADLLSRGQTCLTSGDHSAAVEIFEELLADRSLSLAQAVICHNQIALALAELDRIPEACGHLETAITLAPGDDAAYYNLAHLLIGVQDYTRAFDLARTAARCDARDLDNWRLLASTAVLTQDLAVAEEALYRAAALDSTQYDIWSNLGTLLLRQDREPEAERAFTRAAACPGAPAEAYRNLGRLAAAKGDLNTAKVNFAKAEELEGR